MSRLPGIILSGTNLGGDQTARAFQLALVAGDFNRRKMLDQLTVEDQQMQRAEHQARMDRNTRDDQWAREDRTRQLAERQAAQTYYTQAAVDESLFATHDPLSGAAQSDVGAMEAFSQLPPDVQAERLRAHDTTRRYQDANRNRLQVEALKQGFQEKRQLAKIAYIESEVRPKFGDAVADRALALAQGVTPSSLPKMESADGEFGGETTRVSVPNPDGKIVGATVPKGGGRPITPEIMQSFRQMAESDPNVPGVSSWYWTKDGRRMAEVSRDVAIQRRAEQLAAQAGWKIPRGPGPADSPRPEGEAPAKGSPAAPPDELEVETVGEAILEQLREKYGGDLPEEARAEFKRMMKERFPDLEDQ